MGVSWPQGGAFAGNKTHIFADVNVERNSGGSGACQSAPHRAMKRLTSWRKKVLCWMKGSWRRREQRQSSKSGRGVRSLAVCGQFSLLSERMERL